MVANGRDTALPCLTLMDDVAGILPPVDIIDAYQKSFAPGAAGHSEFLWGATDAKTGEVMALGARYLTMIWEAAWTADGGSGNPGKQSESDLRDLYEQVNFVRSVTVDDIENEIAHPMPF